MIERKIMLLGEIGVGKTSIAKRLAFGSFDTSYKATIGADIYLYDVEPQPNDTPFRFLVWDVDGSYGDTIFRHVYFKQAQAAMIIADVTRPQTIETMARLAELFTDALPGRFFGLVLNKIDLLNADEDLIVPDKLGPMSRNIVRTSAKTGENVAETFATAAQTIIRRGL
jgi:small GTP-binding protein